MKWLLILTALLLRPAVAKANPCEGALPNRAGQAFSGAVRYIGDGDSLCLGPTPDPATLDRGQAFRLRRARTAQPHGPRGARQAFPSRARPGPELRGGAWSQRPDHRL